MSELKLVHTGSVVLPLHPHLAATLQSASLFRHKNSLDIYWSDLVYVRPVAVLGSTFIRTSVRGIFRVSGHK
jgi:hypothetical protein